MLFKLSLLYIIVISLIQKCKVHVMEEDSAVVESRGQVSS